jgi:hypothetical protein
MKPQPTQHSADTRRAVTKPQQFPPLETVTRPTVDTAAAAYYLNRKPQTLRGWACAETFPDGLRPHRVMGRLMWPVSELRLVLEVA